MIPGITLHSLVWHYSLPTQLGIADHEIGRICQWQGTTRWVHRYKFI